MRILLDAFGGDNTPLEAIKGAVKYVEEGGECEISLVGKKDEIDRIFAENDFSKKNITVTPASEVITCEESPTEAVRKKPDSSMCVGLKALRQKEAEAFVSAGSTGALLTGSVLKVGRIKGASRPALATLLPTVKGGKVLFMDCGANADCKPINLVHFAIMADAYLRTVSGIKSPKIALLSNGTEDKKGNELIHEVFPVLKNLKSINFVGNVEGRDILEGEVDAVIADGFSGNVAIKSLEGAISAMLSVLKQNIKSSLKAKIGYKFFMQKAFRKTKDVLDYNKAGGAVFLGIDGVLMKCHGSSKETSFKNALFQAETAIKADVNGEISKNLTAEEVTAIEF